MIVDAHHLMLPPTADEKYITLETEYRYANYGPQARGGIQILRDLPSKAPAGLKFTREKIDAILGGNAKKVYNL